MKLSLLRRSAVACIRPEGTAKGRIYWHHVFVPVERKQHPGLSQFWSFPRQTRHAGDGWGKGSASSGLVVPDFYKQERTRLVLLIIFMRPFFARQQALLLCCRHTPLLNSGKLLTDWRQIDAG